MKYTLVFTLRGALADAVAVEWTDQDAPEGSGAGWEPCLRRADGSWRFSSVDPVAAPRHRRDPGPFANIGLRYRLAATGPWSEVSANRKEIVILDVSEESDDGDGGTEPPAAPLLIAAPTLAGAGTIGTPLTADPGLWTSAETPDFAYLWLRDEVVIAGATEAVYVPGPKDDLSDVAVWVTATNAGGATEAVSAALRVTYAAPVARGALLDEVFDQGPGEQVVETAEEFTGENLRFAIEATGGLNATIEPATGLLRIATDVALSGAEVAVTAGNSGGSARSAFLVTIEAVDGPDDLPVPLAAEDWAIAAVVEVAPGQYTAEIEIAAGSPADGAVALYWSNWVNRYQEVPFEMAPLGGRRWSMTGIVGGSETEWHLKAPGETLDNLMLRYQPVAGGPVSDNSADAKSWQAPVAEAPREPVETARPAPVALRTSISMPGGVVWTFNKSMPCGQYWNGDWFVHNAVGAGGFNVTSVTPDSIDRPSNSFADLSQKRKNGLMRDPRMQRLAFRDQQAQGLDEAVVGKDTHRYDPNLNINPNWKGNVVFADGQEGSLVKAVAAPDSASTVVTKSTIDYLHFLTVVRNVPKVNAFRPSPDGDITSKASIATTADVDFTPFVQTNLASSPSFSMANTKKYLTGPFLSPTRLGRANAQLYGRQQVVDKTNALYGPVFSQAVWSAMFYVCSNSTSNADRQELVYKMCQIGLDYIQSGSSDRYEYWPSHNAYSWHMMIHLAAMCCDNTAVRAAYNKAMANKFYHRELMQGATFAENGAAWGTGDKFDLRYIDETDIYFRCPPEGGQSDRKPDNPAHTPFIADQEFGQTPYTGGMIGFPWSAGQGNTNEGFQANHNMSYNFLDRLSVPLLSMIACLTGAKRDGLELMNDIGVKYSDRVERMTQGHLDGTWNMGESPEWSGSDWTIWTQGDMNLWKHIRALGVAKGITVWTGRPEQPMPPSVSKPAAGQLRMTFHKFRMSNNGPLTGAQYRLRRIKTSNVSGSWQLNTELRNLVFRNTAPWQTPVSMSTTATNITVSGLAGGIWQVQWRLQNASGWGPWSTNVGYAGDERPKNGWPAGPRAVILI